MIANTPLAEFIGNEESVAKMARYALAAKSGELPKPCISILGPASTGKTMLARLTARQAGLPLVELQPHSIRTLKDVYKKIIAVNGRLGRDKIAKPCIVFIDEVHAINRKVSDGLLKAIEQSDCVLETEDSRSLDTHNISWLIATTARGELDQAFDTRFDKVKLRCYSKLEVAEIIQKSFPEFNFDCCQRVAHYCGLVPREALFFAREVLADYARTGNSPKEIVERVAADNQIDERGMTFDRMSVLKALSQGPVSARNLACMVHMKTKELERFTLPPLLAITKDRPTPIMTVSSRGYSLTPAGVKELEFRNIDCSEEVMPAAIRSKYNE